MSLPSSAGGRDVFLSRELPSMENARGERWLYERTCVALWENSMQGSILLYKRLVMKKRIFH